MTGRAVVSEPGTGGECRGGGTGGSRSHSEKLLQVRLDWDGGGRGRLIVAGPEAGCGLAPGVVRAAVVDGPSGAADPAGYGEQGAAQE